VDGRFVALVSSASDTLLLRAPPVRATAREPSGRDAVLFMTSGLLRLPGRGATGVRQLAAFDPSSYRCPSTKLASGAPQRPVSASNTRSRVSGVVPVPATAFSWHLSPPPILPDSRLVPSRYPQTGGGSGRVVQGSAHRPFTPARPAGAGRWTRLTTIPGTVPRRHRAPPAQGRLGRPRPRTRSTPRLEEPSAATAPAADPSRP